MRGGIQGPGPAGEVEHRRTSPTYISSSVFYGGLESYRRARHLLQVVQCYGTKAVEKDMWGCRTACCQYFAQLKSSHCFRSEQTLFLTPFWKPTMESNACCSWARTRSAILCRMPVLFLHSSWLPFVLLFKLILVLHTRLRTTTDGYVYISIQLKLVTDIAGHLTNLHQPEVQWSVCLSGFIPLRTSQTDPSQGGCCTQFNKQNMQQWQKHFHVSTTGASVSAFFGPLFLLGHFSKLSGAKAVFSSMQTTPPEASTALWATSFWQEDPGLTEVPEAANIVADLAYRGGLQLCLTGGVSHGLHCNKKVMWWE